MEKKLLDKIKKRLEKEIACAEQEISKFAKKDANLKGDWDTQFPDIGMETTDDVGEDVAKKREEYERLLPVEHALEIKMKNIGLALQKIKKNKYGVCEKCGKKIPQKRLLAIPEARTCQSCTL